MKFDEMIKKLEDLDLTTPEKKKQPLKIDWLEHEVLPKVTSSFAGKTVTEWWDATNDPTTWHMSKETWHEYKAALEQQMFYGKSAVPASASSNGMYWSAKDNLTNYIQVYAKEDLLLGYPGKMTREKAIALNNGD